SFPDEQYPHLSSPDSERAIASGTRPDGRSVDECRHVVHAKKAGPRLARGNRGLAAERDRRQRNSDLAAMRRPLLSILQSRAMDRDSAAGANAERWQGDLDDPVTN